MMPYLPNWIDGDSKVFLPAKDVDIDLLSGKEKNNLVNGNVIAFEKNNKIIIKNLADNTEKSFEIFKDVQYINVSISPNGTKYAEMLSSGYGDISSEYNTAIAAIYKRMKYPGRIDQICHTEIQRRYDAENRCQSGSICTYPGI